MTETLQPKSREREFDPSTGQEHDVVYIGPEGEKYLVCSFPDDHPLLQEVRRRTIARFGPREEQVSQEQSTNG